MATSKLRPLIESQMARTAIEHLNEPYNPIMLHFTEELAELQPLMMCLTF